MTKETGLKLFKMIITNNGRPSSKELEKEFGMREGREISRQLYLATFATYTDEKLVELAKVAYKKFR